MNDHNKFLKGKIRPPKAVRAYRAGQAPDTESSESEDREALDQKSLASLGTLKTFHTIPAIAALGEDLRSTVIKGGFKKPEKSQGLSKTTELSHTTSNKPQNSVEKSHSNSIAEKPLEKILEAEEVEVVQRRRKPIIQEQNIEANNLNIKQDEISTEEHLGKRKPMKSDIDVSRVEKKTKGNIEDNDSNDDSEEDSDDNIFEAAPKLKISRPVFVNSELRQYETLEDVEHARQEQDKALLKASIYDRNQSMVVESKKDRVEAADDALSDSEIDLPNDSTEDEDIAYEKWKVRELGRLKRDREEQEKVFKEKEAIERRRMMTDEERAKDDKRIGKYKQDQKSHYRFMQKHYSMGIYNRDDDDPLFKRDYNIAVGEDLFDKSALPMIKQVRRGEEHRKGKSKYTHLVAEDTTNFDPEWVPAEELRNKYKNMTAGYKNSGVFERPSKYR